MDTETELKRSVFLGVRQQQQLEKYRCENTYQVYIKNTDDTSYEEGVSQHNKFSIKLDAVGKEHIRNCKITLKTLKLPSATTSGANYKGEVFLSCNLAKNTISSGGRKTNIIGSAYVKEAYKTEVVVVPEIRTNAGVPSGGGTITKNAIGTNLGIITDNAGGHLNIADIAGADYIAAIPNIHQSDGAGGNYNLSRQINKGCYGWCSKTTTFCSNPFGKNLDFSILANDMSSLAELGVDAGDGVDMLLEIELLPDYKENDRLNY
jgi:hypothetical protein